MPTTREPASAWETLFWTVFEQSRNPMALIDEEMLYVDVNPVHAEVFGRARDDIVGTRLDAYLPENELPTVEAEHNEFLSAGEYSGERRYIRADGSVVRVQYAAASETITGRKLALFVSNVVEEDEADEDSNGAGASHAVLSNDENLSPREREVVRLVAMGMTSRQIAQELTVSTETVRTHIRNALAKTGTRTRAQLVAKVMAQGTFNAD
jgi:PAS domain S-box-containing protein